MKKLSKALAVVMALCMLLLCVACGDKPTTNNGGNDEKTYNLVFTTHLPETGVDGASLKYFLEQVTKETNGRVTFETYFGGSMTKSGETLKAVSGGLADIAFVPEGFCESQFYPLFVAMLPYSTTSEWVANKALKEMFDTYAPFTEMCKKQGVVNLGPVVPSEVVIVSTKKPINGLADMQGLKIRAMGAVNSEMSMLGATPVALDASEIYEALERDTVAAATGIPVTLAVSYKLQEVADYFIFSGIGTYTTSSLYMNEKTWNSLPEDIQKAFRTVYDRFVDEYTPTTATTRRPVNSSCPPTRWSILTAHCRPFPTMRIPTTLNSRRAILSRFRSGRVCPLRCTAACTMFRGRAASVRIPWWI